MISLREGATYRVRRVGGVLSADEVHKSDSRDGVLLQDSGVVPSVWDVKSVRPAGDLEGVKDGGEVFVTRTPEGLMEYDVRRRPVAVKISMHQGVPTETLVEQEGDVILDPDEIIPTRIVGFKELGGKVDVSKVRGGDVFLAKSVSERVFELETKRSESEEKALGELFFKLVKSVGIVLVFGTVDKQEGSFTPVVWHPISQATAFRGDFYVANIYSDKTGDDERWEIKNVRDVGKLKEARNILELEEGISFLTPDGKRSLLHVLNLLASATENQHFIDETRALEYYLQRISRTLPKG